MKKYSILFFLLATLAVSCKKEKEVINVNPKQNNQAFAREAGEPIAVLNFTSYDQYEAFVSNADGVTLPTPPSDFVSLRSIIEELDYQRNNDTDAYLSNPHLPDTLYENYGRLLDVLNEDKIVNLNGNLVRVDLYNESVYSINSTSIDAYDMLISNPTSEDVTTESTNIEVAARLFGRPSCRDRYASARHAGGDQYCDNRHRTKKDINYQTAGIYFSLVAEAKSQERFLRIWWAWSNYPYVNETSFSWVQRCGNSMNWSGTAWLFDNISYDYNDHKANFRPYQSARALRTYSFGAKLSGCGGDTYLHISN